jgi:hypothetical protein
MSAIRSGIIQGNTAGYPPSLCFGCGKEYQPARWNQLRCRPNCGRSRVGAWATARPSAHKHAARTATRAAPQVFIGVDGEGVTDPVTGEHRYVLLSCGDRHLSQDSAHLQFGEILTFMWACFEEDYSDEACPVYVGFYLKYDFSQWIRTLPEDRARWLLDPVFIAKRQRREPHRPPAPVFYQGWEFDYLPGKRFRLRPEGKTKISRIEGGKLVTPWMYVNDTGSYFQSSFLKAINPVGNQNPVVTLEEYNIIAEGKRRRETAEFDPAMIKYNLLECQVLARLMAQLGEGMRKEELKPQRDAWHGPGQLAQLWLGKIKAPKGQAVRDATPETVREAARASYYGGWFELFWHGPVPGEAWGYDINSAYSAVMAALPCILHGEWTQTVERPAGRLLTRPEQWALREGLVFIRARLEGSHSVIGAMLHRNPQRSILRPRTTEGWFVGTELAAACDAAFVSKVREFERWTFQAHCNCPPPLAPLAELYVGRIAVGKATPQGKAMKLIYNSCAGKIQQSIGQPAYANPVYGTLITAGCRTLIAQAIGSHPKGAQHVLMVATDGVVFRSPHTRLDLDKERLGAWTENRHQNLSLFMPGVYWDDDDRERIRKGEQPVFKSRGIAARDLSQHIAAIDRAWSRPGWPKMTLPVGFQLVSPKQALDRKKWELCGCVISADKPATWPIDKKTGKPKKPVRVISADPKMKRVATKPGQSQPWQEPKELVSLPYDGSFGEELRAFAEDEFGDHPDGPIGEMLAEAMHDN